MFLKREVILFDPMYLSFFFFFFLPPPQKSRTKTAFEIDAQLTCSPQSQVRRSRQHANYVTVQCYLAITDAKSHHES